MTFSELLIIYLSLGAPVAVYYLQQQIHLNGAHAAVRVLFAFLLWPATFVKVIVDSGPNSENTFVENSSADAANAEFLQTILELGKRDLSQSGRAQDVAQFREMLERYAGLLSASRSGGSDEGSVSEFYVAAGHPSPELATACHLRHVTAKLDSHSRAVSAEVRQFFAEFFEDSTELRSAVASFAQALGDLPTFEALAGTTANLAGRAIGERLSQIGRVHNETARAA